jgi:hypothetical protein
MLTQQLQEPITESAQHNYKYNVLLVADICFRYTIPNSMRKISKYINM